MGAMGWRYHEDDELVELVGGEHDDAIVMPGFSLDVQALQVVFERVTALHWHAQGLRPDDEDGPHISALTSCGIPPDTPCGWHRNARSRHADQDELGWRFRGLLGRRPR